MARAHPSETAEMIAGRDHHCRFVHSDLPRDLWKGDSLLGILANPNNQDLLRERWDRARAREHGIELVDTAALGYQSIWLGGEHLVFLLRFPGQAPRHRTLLSTLLGILPRWEKSGSGSPTTPLRKPGAEVFATPRRATSDRRVAESSIRSDSSRVPRRATRPLRRSRPCGR